MRRGAIFGALGACAEQTALRCGAPVNAGDSRRAYNAAYGTKLRSHPETVAAFAPASAEVAAALQCNDGADFARRITPLLTDVEDRLRQWKLSKWDYRVPPTLQGAEKEEARRQIAAVRKLLLDRVAARDDETRCLEVVREHTNTSLSLAEIAEQPRSWLEEKVQDLRFNGQVDKGRELRQAWLRLEDAGGPHAALLERLCYVYALGRLGAFDHAFANTIEPATAPPSSSSVSASAPSSDSLFRSLRPLTTTNSGGTARLNRRDILRDAMEVLLINVPTLPILHDFVGLHGQRGAAGAQQGAGRSYRESLGLYLTEAVQQQLLASKNGSGSENDPGKSDSSTTVTALGHRVPAAFAQVADADQFSKPQSLVRAAGSNAKGERIVLFDYRLPADRYTAFPGPPCDFLFLRGTDVTLISIASPNKYLREQQIVPETQCKGIARRAAMLFGSNLNAGRCRTLLLPPSFMDKRNLLRLHCVLGIDGDLHETDPGLAAGTAPTIPTSCRGWATIYDKELSVEEEDYAIQAKVAHPADDWVRL